MQVLNLVKEVEVEPDSTTPGSFHIKAEGGFRTRKAVQGLGVLYFYWAGEAWTPREHWNKSLYMPKPKHIGTGARLKVGEPGVSVKMADLFPCSGAVSPELGGFLVAPAVKIDVAEGKDIAAMLISPHPSPTRVSVGKSSLSIPHDGSEVRVELSANGELSCEGAVSASGISAKLLLTRNSNPPISGLALSEELAEAKEPGNISVRWKPVTRSFEDLLFVFRPLEVQLGDLDELVEHVGASTQSFDETGETPFVVGDGAEGSYTLKLALKRHLRSVVADETAVTVT